MDFDEDNSKSPEIPSDDLNLDDTDLESFDDIEKDTSGTTKELKTQDILEKNLGVVKFYDFIVNNPLNVIFQPKLIDQYHNDLITPLLGTKNNPPENADRGRLFLHDEYYDLEIKTKSKKVIDIAENIAKDNGFKSSFNRRSSIWQIVMSTGAIGLYFILLTFTEINQFILLLGSIGFMLVGNNVMRTLLQKRWAAFQKEHEKEIYGMAQAEIQDIKRFIQDAIDDTRDRLLTQNLPLERFQFVLFSSDYQNVTFVRNQVPPRGGMIKAIYQFAYPEGMQPQPSNKYGSSEIPEDDQNDEFIILRNTQFNEDGKLDQYTASVASPKIQHLADLLLNISEFQSVDIPEELIPNFHDYQFEIECSCKNPVKFNSMKTCSSPLHKGFEFYLILAEKCTCGKNPFILLNSPGNQKIAEGLEPIFE